MGYPTVSDYARSYVRARAQAHMNCEVVIYSFAPDQVLDENTGLYTAQYGDELYDGVARIYSVDSGGAIAVGEETINTKTTFCSIPWDNQFIAIDTYVEVTSFPGDEQLEDTFWRVVGTDGGGLMRATRRMQITAWTDNRHWQKEI